MAVDKCADMCESESRWENLDHDHDGDQVKIDQQTGPVGGWGPIRSDSDADDDSDSRPMTAPLRRLLLAPFVQPAVASGGPHMTPAAQLVSESVESHLRGAGADSEGRARRTSLSLFDKRVCVCVEKENRKWKMVKAKGWPRLDPHAHTCTCTRRVSCIEYLVTCISKLFVSQSVNRRKSKQSPALSLGRVSDSDLWQCAVRQGLIPSGNRWNP